MKQPHNSIYFVCVSSSCIKFTARIIAVDTATKIIRFSLNPHILTLRGKYASFPHHVGAIIENAHVIRVDSGIGALLALPGSDDREEDEERMEDILQLDKDLGNNLYSIPEYKTASTVRTAYVHISKSIDCKDTSSTKKGKGNKSANRTPEALFARHFSINTKIKALRILSTSHMIDGIASCATAKSIVDAHVLTHEDIAPGAIYRNVPVIQMLDGGGVLVDLGVGTKGIIPASHLFDKASHGSLDTGCDMVLSGYRQKIRSAKFKEGSLVDVRCLTCDPTTKQCVLTAKKTLLSTDIDNPIIDYAPPSMEVGRVAAGFISRVDENGITVTFYNNVHGRVSSRSLAAELGVEDPRLNYNMGDVVMARVVDCQRRRNRNVTNDDEENLYYYHLTLSLKTVVEEKSDPAPMEEDGVKDPSGLVPFVAGSVLATKKIKVLQLVNCLKRDDGMFLSGYAVVGVKAKFFTGLSRSGDSVEFKLPYDHLLDSFGDELSSPPFELDAVAAKHLTVGKKIDAEALILSVPKGIDTLPIISLRPTLIRTIKNSSSSDGEGTITCPSPTSNLFVGEYVHGYVCRRDERFGAFVRFLDGLTGLIPKLKKGLDEKLYDTILCKVTALDITASPPKILLKKVKESEIAQKTKKSGAKPVKSNETVHVGDVVDVKIADINFARANVYIIGKSGEAKSRARIHVTMAEFVSTKHKLSKKEKQSKEEMKISKNHPFYK
jgi:predicted RNA-binding protein with RPS1 domain